MNSLGGRRATAEGRAATGRGPWLYTALTACAWLALVLIHVSEQAWYFGHEVLGARSVPPPLALAGFSTGWLLMSLAMMLPGVLPALARLHGTATGRLPSAWLAGYLSPWMLLGFAFAAVDLVVHVIVAPRYPLSLARVPTLLWLMVGVQVLGRALGGGYRRRHGAGSACESEQIRDVRTAFLGGWRAGLADVRHDWLLMIAASAVHGEAVRALVAMCVATVLMNLSPHRGLANLSFRRKVA